MQAAHDLDQIGMKIWSPNFIGSCLTIFTDTVVHFQAIFFNQFLDTGWMNPTVLQEGLHGHPSNFPANRIKTREHNHFWRVINDDINTCQTFKGPNIAAFTPDNPPLHGIIWQVNRGHCLLSHILARNPLHGLGQKVFGCLVRPLFDFPLRLFDATGHFVSELISGFC